MEYIVFHDVNVIESAVTDMPNCFMILMKIHVYFTLTAFGNSTTYLLFMFIKINYYLRNHKSLYQN